MLIAVASGKGGTGKTTVAVNLAMSLVARGPVQFIDCDVEEPNAHIFLKPVIERSQEIFIPFPEIDKGRCTYCGECAKICEFNAMAVVPGSVLVFPDLCHGCGACTMICPERAIREVGKRMGVIESGHAGAIEFFHGRLDIGQASSLPLIRELKKKVSPAAFSIVDVPPGTSCPVVESLRESDFSILVTEPTPFGLHDLELAAGVAKKLGVPSGVVINRTSLGDGEGPIRDFCRAEKIPVMMNIPFDRKIAEAYSKGETIFEALPSYREKFSEISKQIAEKVS